MARGSLWDGGVILDCNISVSPQMDPLAILGVGGSLFRSAFIRCLVRVGEGVAHENNGNSDVDSSYVSGNYFGLWVSTCLGTSAEVEETPAACAMSGITLVWISNALLADSHVGHDGQNLPVDGVDSV